MRTLLLSTIAITTLAVAYPSAEAFAQERVVRSSAPDAAVRSARWETVPGGWAAYRRPYIGWTLPRYWTTPEHQVTAFERHGLPTPRPGHRWQRYYDDAVMVDASGKIADVREGIVWNAAQDSYYADRSYADGVYDDRLDDDRVTFREEVARAAPPPPPPPPPARRDDGVGGAVIGGPAGGVAGNVIAGDGNRLAGTAIGAGVGAVAGVAIDRAEDRGRAPGASYPPPPAGGQAYAQHRAPTLPPRYRDDEPPVAPDDGPDRYYDEPGYGYDDEPGYGYDEHYRYGYDLADYERRYAPPPPVATHTGPGRVTTTTTQTGGGYFTDGWYYPPTTITTIVVTPPCNC